MDGRVKNLGEKLGSRIWFIRKSAARALGETYNLAAVQPLINALKDKNRFVRKNAAEALGKIGDPVAVRPLTDALTDKSESVRNKATEALKKIDDPDIVQLIIRYLKNKSPAFQGRAAEALGKTGDPKAVQPLISALKDSSSYVCKNAAWALGEIGDPVSVKPLIETLKHKDRHVRGCAAEALGKIGDPSSVQPLINTLKDYTFSHFFNRIGYALSKIGNKDTGESFIAALKDNYIFVSEKAAEALTKISGKSTVQLLIIALKNIDKNIRKSAAEVLGEIGDPDAIEPLIEALKDEYQSVFEGAAKSLGKIGDPCAIQPIRNEAGLNMTHVEKFFKNIFIIRDKRSLQIANNAINTIISLNKLLWKNHPYLFCRKCVLRTKRIQKTVGLLETYEFIACRNCETCLYLIKNIRQVIGLIGSNIEDFYQNGDKIYISLWSEQEKKARNADIDVLEIRDTKGINYDYAINAVLVTLKNDASRPREYVKNIHVVIRGNPPIPEGAKVILNHEFGGIRNERYRSESEKTG